MKDRLGPLNLAGVLVALGLSAYGSQLGARPNEERAAPARTAFAPALSARGEPMLLDAGGRAVPLVHYARIASGSLISDRVLADLCEPTRIVAFSAASLRHPRFGHRYQGKPLLTTRAPLETVLALKPDLLLVNNMVDPGYLARVREQGVRVFDLGHMQGLSTLLPSIRAIGALIGAPERADEYARALEARMQRLGQGLAPQRALYLAAYGDRLFGGAQHTSYHDVLTAVGFIDVAAEAGIAGWPELSPEQVLSLAPDVVVTRVGMGRVVCGRQGLALLPACTRRGGIIELAGGLLDDPGPGMLDAAEALRDARLTGRDL